MTSRGFAVGLVFGVVGLFGTAGHAAPVKVSCVGEQSTHSGHPAAGAGHEWPDELGVLLGAAYTVDNDGDSGHSSVLMNDAGATPVPYTNNGGSYANPANAAIAATGGGGFVRSIVSPDVVVIGPWGMHDYLMAMGNNLALTQARFQPDYDFLVGIYGKLANKPKIFLMTPLPFPAGGNVSAGTQDYMKNAILPAVKDVATKRGLPLIDVYAAFMAAPATPALLATDGGVTLAGSQKIAQMVMAALGGSATDGGVKDSGSTGAGGGTAGTGGGTAGADGGVVGTGGGTAGAAGGTAGAGTAGAGGGTAGTGGGTTGAGGTTGTAGAGGATTGTAGTGAIAGTGGSAAGTAGTGTAAGTAGSGASAHSSGGGCSLANAHSKSGVLASVLVALALALPAWRRRRRTR